MISSKCLNFLCMWFQLINIGIVISFQSTAYVSVPLKLQTNRFYVLYGLRITTKSEYKIKSDVATQTLHHMRS